MLFLVTLALIFASLGAPLVAGAAGPQNLVDLGNMLAGILNGGSTFLIGVALVLVFWNLFKAVFDKVKRRDASINKTILWTLFVFFIMVSIWGIIQLLQNTFFSINTGTTSSGGSTPSSLQFTNTPPQLQ